MLLYENSSYDLLIKTITPDLHYQRIMFIESSKELSQTRLSRLVTTYNVPPGSERWFVNRMSEYYANLLYNWEISQRTREQFLLSFIGN